MGGGGGEISDHFCPAVVACCFVFCLVLILSLSSGSMMVGNLKIKSSWLTVVAFLFFRLLLTSMKPSSFISTSLLPLIACGCAVAELLS